MNCVTYFGLDNRREWRGKKPIGTNDHDNPMSERNTCGRFPVEILSSPFLSNRILAAILSKNVNSRLPAQMQKVIRPLFLNGF
jgi:hypothetical protein